MVATVDLPSGTVIEAEDVTVDTRPAHTLGEYVFVSVDQVLGQKVGDAILSGESVRPERLMAGGARQKVEEVIDPGTRAMTLRAARDAAVGGLVGPGSFVDVIVTIRPDTESLAAEWVTKTILQGVRVIAVGDEVGAPGDPEVEAEEEARQTARERREVFVTLEVEPEEAEQLALAAARGRIHLSLRAVGDLEARNLGEPLVANALVGLPPPVKKAQTRRLARKRATPPPRRAG